MPDMTANTTGQGRPPEQGADRKLLAAPMWRAADVGRPLPNEPHAVSVCLPQWRHVVAYEEGDAELIERFFTGYPRFCCHRYQQQLFTAGERFAGADEAALVFPSPASAARCAAFLHDRGIGGARAVEWPDAGFGVALFPRDAYRTARLYWRYCGEVIGSRRAAGVLNALGVPGVAADDTAPDEGARARAEVRDRLAALSGTGGANVFLFPSGMAAMAAVHRALTAMRPGAATVQCDFPYVDVFRVQQALGSGAHFHLWRDEAEGLELRRRIETTPLAAIYTEVPSNPLLRCVDLPQLHAWAAAAGVPLVADDTIGSAANLDLLPHADVVTTSLTKYFSGAGNVMAGCAIVNPDGPRAGALSAALAVAERESGGLADGDAVVLERNSRDFVARMRRVNVTTAALVDRLRRHRGLTIHYPDMSPGSSCRRLTRERLPATTVVGGGDALAGSGDAPGGGGLFSIVFDDPGRAPRFFDALRVSKGPSLGTNFTLACPYTLLAHYEELDWAAQCGVAAHLVRVSVGLEDADDLGRRFEEALEIARQGEC